ncbi:MAG TPA: hypothetical protein VKA40_08675 [Nitrososphaera sp.]|nr:hypothetical protein [Nitrososphaera sp.]
MNSRPQINSSFTRQFIAYLKEELWKENLIVQITFAPLFFFFLSALCSTIPSSEVILRKS